MRLTCSLRHKELDLLGGVPGGEPQTPEQAELGHEPWVRGDFGFQSLCAADSGSTG